MLSTKELLKEQYEQTKNRPKDNRAYLEPGETAIIDAIDEQNGGGEGGEGGEGDEGGEGGEGGE